MESSPLHPKPLQTVLATAGGILFVSTASIFIRFAQTEASSLVIAASRLVIATLILGPLAFMRHRDAIGSLSRRDFFKALLSGTFLAFHFAAWISSLQYTTVASSVVLVTTTPLWVALLSPLVLREPIRKMVIFGLILSVTGGVIVGLGNACDVAGGKLVCDPLVFTSRIMLGNGLALFGAWMAAGYMLIGRQIRKKLNTVPYTALVYGVAALILVVVVLLRGDPFWTYSEEIYLWLLALGIFPQLLGHSLFNWSLKYISAAYVSLTLLGEPIGTIILAFFFLKESPTLLEGVGALLILIGILVGSLGRKTRSSAA
jgi:drug/metabolite transporter (DMT)-like permease